MSSDATADVFYGVYLDNMPKKILKFFEDWDANTEDPSCMKELQDFKDIKFMFPRSLHGDVEIADCGVFITLEDPCLMIWESEVVSMKDVLKHLSDSLPNCPTYQDQINHIILRVNAFLKQLCPSYFPPTFDWYIRVEYSQMVEQLELNLSQESGLKTHSWWWFSKYPPRFCRKCGANITFEKRPCFRCIWGIDVSGWISVDKVGTEEIA